MESGIEKCATLLLNIGSRETMEGKDLPNWESIRALEKKKTTRKLLKPRNIFFISNREERKLKKRNTSEEENFLKLSASAEISSKE